MSFNLASKINRLVADQDELLTQIVYITSLAPNTLNNLSSIATSLNNDLIFLSNRYKFTCPEGGSSDYIRQDGNG